MLKNKSHAVATIVAGLSVGATALAIPSVGLAAEPVSDGAAPLPVAQDAPANVAVESPIVMAKAIGTFSYDQSYVSPTSAIRAMQGASQFICGGADAASRVSYADWEITVSGDVESEFTATLGDMVETEPVSHVMTCSCGGNPAGGRAIATAAVKGVPVEYLLQASQASADVNTVTFVAADGTEVSMPLAYAIGRHAVISCEVNDADIAESVGSANQLWLARTPANYFVRDIVEVVFTAEDEVPANPGEGAEHPNSPNAGILTGVQA